MLRAALVLTAALLAMARLSHGQGSQPGPIPLCAGLTIVTAISGTGGDYESIKTVESVDETEVRVKYSSEAMVQDLFDTAPKLQRTDVTRIVRRGDLAAAHAYLQRFTPLTPELVPGTTAVGTSAAVIHALRKAGTSKLAIFGPFAGAVPLDRNVHPNVYDHEMTTEVRRVGAAAVPVRVMVNDRLVDLPAIDAEGNFFGDQSEFFFLDDPANPLTLKFRIGIRPPDPARVEMAKIMKQPVPTSGDRETLQVVRLSVRCGGAATETGGGAGAGAGVIGAGKDLPGGGTLERALAEDGRADVYDIFFSFGSAELRPESTATLDEIARLLAKYPAWRLTIAGHTDGIASEAFNLDLSRRRSAAVRDVLVSKHRIVAARLATAGYGESQPRDTNDTLEGRARNRRVELVRQP